jgi:hypothetical protein
MVAVHLPSFLTFDDVDFGVLVQWGHGVEWMSVNIVGNGLYWECFPDLLAVLVWFFEVKWPNESLFLQIHVALCPFVTNGGLFDGF